MIATNAWGEYAFTIYSMIRKIPQSAIEPVELRWVHFRGNLRIEPLGTGGNALVMQPGESVKQYTRAGHLFVAMRLQSTEEEANYAGDLFA
eukprot:gene33080-37381_t